jgi:hypothetical protein
VTQIVIEERDPILRQLVLYHAKDRCVIPGSIDYALRCHRTADQNGTAVTIAAAAVARRTVDEIAEDLHTTRMNVLVTLRLLFDIRGVNEFLMKEICFDPSRHTVLPASARRRLVTAYQQGWSGVVQTYANPRSRAPAGQQQLDRLLLTLMSRSADFVTMLEMNGVDPTGEEVAMLLQLKELEQKRGAGQLRLLEYPTPVTAEEERRRREAEALVGKLPAASRRKLSLFYEKLRAGLA